MLNEHEGNPLIRGTAMNRSIALIATTKAGLIRSIELKTHTGLAQPPACRDRERQPIQQTLRTRKQTVIQAPRGMRADQGDHGYRVMPAYSTTYAPGREPRGGERMKCY